MKTKTLTKKELEILILKKVDQELKRKSASINLIEGDLEVLKGKIKDQTLKEKVTKLEKTLREITKKYQKIKEQMQVIDNGELALMDDITLEESFVKYRALFDSVSQSELERQYKDSEFFLYLIHQMDKLKEEEQDLENQIALKKEELGIRDTEFNEMTLKMLRVDEISKEVAERVKKEQNYLADLEQKVDKITSKEIEETFFVKVNDLIGDVADFSIKVGLGSLAFGTLGAIFVGALSIKDLTKGLNDFFKKETRKRIVYECEDFENEILRNISDVNYVASTVSDALSDVRNLKYFYQTRFAKYANSIPSYNETFKKIEGIEESLEQRKLMTEELNRKLNTNYNKNKEKVKKVRELTNKS